MNSQQQYLNEDVDDDDIDDDEEERRPSQHIQTFLALNAPVAIQTEVKNLDLMLQEREIGTNCRKQQDEDAPSVISSTGADEKKEDANNDVIIPFNRDKDPVNLDEPFLLAKAFPQLVRAS